MDNLKQQELNDKINMIVLSDHGMAPMVVNGTYIMRDYVNTAWINSTRTVYGVTANIYPTPGNVSL
jgi:predicted AlkP superfamily pyrophosphatase or phosphodiesterase